MKQVERACRRGQALVSAEIGHWILPDAYLVNRRGTQVTTQRRYVHAPHTVLLDLHGYWF